MTNTAKRAGSQAGATSPAAQSTAGPTYRARRLTVLDAPSSLGLRPNAHGGVPGTYKAPGILRGTGLVRDLRAEDAGAVVPAPYNAARTFGTVRNEAAIADFSLRLADRLGGIADRRGTAVVLGGDCSILVGVGVALRRRGRFGLVSFDGLDYRHPGNSDAVGSAGGESLALVTGLGGSLADLDGLRSYVRSGDVVSIGPRPDDEFATEAARNGIRVIDSRVAARAPAEAAQEALDTVTRPELDGFWVHLDADVIDPGEMPAVDSPEPEGLSFDHLTAALAPLLADPRLAGLDATIYDPDLDPHLRCGRRLSDLLVSAFAQGPETPLSA
ncbi:arginase family protein [Streptomonospora wellingtoniae]|uniref:Arginase family protein n=1 Tax=Streptomonospora wellingtoniae TaxID=3075544 RepID=A0ABU2KSL9_9ACTN|nr:arginase family protein [Streptomonospora sp. DSM 45055]MDT0302286.1 arginase family protein [Streptomonospora sp. DSM 45055]